MNTEQEASIRPVVKSVTVPLAPAAAFDLFTARISEWWPMGTHSVSAQAGRASRGLALASGVGGEIVETGDDGTAHVWGEITEWAPGDAFTCTWHPGRTDGLQTVVRVEFTAMGAGTEVTLTHSGWETLGEEGPKTRDGYDGGWNGVLAEFVAAV